MAQVAKNLDAFVTDEDFEREIERIQREADA